MKAKFTGAIALLLLSLMGVVSSYAGDVLVNKSIIDLHQLGLGDAVIIDKIKTSRCNFDTSLDGLKQLKAEGISGDVMSAMILASSQGAASADASAAAGPAAGGDPNDPASAHEPGIWYCQESEGKKVMTKVEPSVITKMESGGGAVWGMAWGVTAKSRADLNGSAAALQISQRRPVFYFYFDPRDQSGNAATGPNEFVLAQMEVRKKDDERRMVVGQMNAYSGSKTGPDQKDVRQVAFERLGPGIYKVTPQKELADGEYAFYYAGNAPMVGYYFVMGTGGKLYDFGIRAGP
jgi:hypothetical protein